MTIIGKPSFSLSCTEQCTRAIPQVHLSNACGALTPLYDSIVNSKFIQYIPVRQVMYNLYILNNSPINCVVQWLEGKINILFYSILFYSILFYFSVFFVFSVFSVFRFFVFFVFSVCFSCFASIRKQRVSIEPKQKEDPPKQFKREYIWVFFKFLGLLRFVSVCYETDLFVSVVSIQVRNTETNRKFLVFGFMKQTETNAKQILFRFVSVRTEIYFCLFRGHPIYTVRAL